ncbi:TIGR04255 family protein [bacterium]|nr:TIGR04255 family protein [bacterium]
MSADRQLDELCYKNNPLKEVIARIDFVSPVSAIDEKLADEVSRAAMESFPISEPRLQVQDEFRLFTPAEAPQHSREKFLSWNFFGEGRTKRFTLTRDHLFVVHNQYSRYEDLKGGFLSVCEAFFRQYREAVPKRLGLRYLNELTMGKESPLQWSKYVARDLLGLLKYDIADSEPTRISQTNVVAFEDFKMRFSFGIMNPDFPAPIRKRQFVLDYDAYFLGSFSTQEIEPKLAVFHDRIQRTFEDSITDKTRELLHGK